MAQTFLGTLEVEYCCNCGIPFGVTREFQKRRLDDHALFHCPAGHAQRYVGETAEDKMRRERDRLAQRVAQKDDEIAEEKSKREHAEKQGIAYKGHVTRIKNRVAAGVCPCCNRTFSNLAQHMHHQHPTYRKEKIA